jgi:peptidyl-prolyl cis-trans isomerase D
MALGFMRRHRRYLYGFLWVVIAAFIFLYAPALQDEGAGTPGEILGRVGGLPITVGEFQKSYLQQRRFYESMYRGRMDPAMLRSLGLEETVFQGLVTDRLIQLEARRLGLAIDDATLAESLKKAPEFQRDGQFLGGAEIRRRLELEGRSVSEFEASLRSQLLRDRLEALVTDGVLVGEAEAEAELRRRTERVSVEYVLVPTERFTEPARAEETEVTAHFAAHTELYRVPERRVVSFALLDQGALQATINVTDTEIQNHYNDNRDDYLRDEQACASHILIKVKESESAPEGHPEAEAESIAQGLLDELRGGADFGELARQRSEDKGSAPQGGDLGCFPRGRMVPQFENVAFSLQPGDLSDLVKSPFGYHIIRLSRLDPESFAPLDEVKEAVRRSLLSERVGTLIEQKAGAVAAALAKGRNLAEAAGEQGLAVEQSPPFARGEAREPLNSPLIAARAFELKVGEPEAQPFSVPRGLVFVELREIQPSRLPELDEVKDRVKQDLESEKAFGLARDLAGQVRVAAANRSLESAASAHGLVRKETPNPVGRGQAYGDLAASRALDRVAFELEVQELSQPIRTSQGYVVLRVTEKQPFDAAAFAQQKAAIIANLRRERQAQLFQAYLSQARERFAVEREADVFRRITG